MIKSIVLSVLLMGMVNHAAAKDGAAISATILDGKYESNTGRSADIALSGDYSTLYVGFDINIYDLQSAIELKLDRDNLEPDTYTEKLQKGKITAVARLISSRQFFFKIVGSTTGNVYFSVLLTKQESTRSCKKK